MQKAAYRPFPVPVLLPCRRGPEPGVQARGRHHERGLEIRGRDALRRADVNAVGKHGITPLAQAIYAAFNRHDGSTGWKQHTVSLTAYKGLTVNLGFLAASAYGNNMFIGDARVTSSTSFSAGLPAASEDLAPGKGKPRSK